MTVDIHYEGECNRCGKFGMVSNFTLSGGFDDMPWLGFVSGTACDECMKHVLPFRQGRFLGGNFT